MALWSLGSIFDVFANRPTDNNSLTAGRMFYPSDHPGDQYIDTGSGWTQVGFASGGGGGGTGLPPVTLPAASTGATSYVLPYAITSPTTSLYRVRRLWWTYGSDYTITTSGGVSTLNILNTAEAPATGDPHALNAV